MHFVRFYFDAIWPVSAGASTAELEAQKDRLHVFHYIFFEAISPVSAGASTVSSVTSPGVSVNTSRERQRRPGVALCKGCVTGSQNTSVASGLTQETQTTNMLFL